ncbi:BICD family-like cargo adapter 2 isoform X1 [Phocoena sinus]|uniref:BICD family-like cargo adapter 2 isoform X1 n=1 Tax=Phocoena sinus TaxID=42100 RepID=UPI0013C44041|nr:BICD family-like cargo adapter 2 isoform X1 [Phocoena sinus]XP_032459883.1 BICD family-like cargo adapter 2 isoform X1 [Phocoena sinus]XP_032459884.1 BICD family-like cargo adapter 2 isoform X1 [Phocoena sinus]
MSSPEGPSFSSGLLSGGTSPSSNEGFFPFMLERRDSFLGGGPRPEEPEDLQLQQKEKDLLLAAELGKMLLERNEELQRRLEMLSAQHSEHEERLQQENHELRRGLAARGAEWEARTVELEGDMEALRVQLGEQRSEQQDSGRERARALSELSEQNLRLSQQLAQASQTEQELQRELDGLRGQCQAQALAGAELRTRLECLQGENQMLQSRRQDLEAQIRGLCEEVEKGQGRLQATHEELLLLRRERQEHSLELELARSEAGEALSALRRLQRQVSELEEESRLQDANISGASLQSELAHSLDSKDQDQNVDRGGDALATLPPETQEASSHQPSPQEERLEPPRKRASLSPAEILEEKEAEVVRLQDEIALQREELQSLREELQRQKELRVQKDPEEILSGALSDRDEAVNKSLELALELSRVSLERDSLSRELLRTIRQKVALTQELEAWQVRGGAGGAVPAGRCRRGRCRRGRCRTLTRPAGPAALSAGRHAGGHRAAAAITTPERAECGWIRPEPQPAAPLAAPGPWARRRLLQQPLPKDLSAWSRGPPLPSLAHFPLLANGATGPDCLPKAAGALSTPRGWARAHREQGPALGARDPRWVAGAGVAELFFESR